MPAPRFEVLTLIGHDWENVWTVEGEPLTFATYVEAVEELVDHLAECTKAYRAGDMREPLTLDEYRIVPCDQPDGWEPIILPEDFAV